LHTTEVDINQLVSETSRLLQRTLGETIRVVARLNPQLRHAVLDHTQMENALVNLSINARDAMPSGGRLTLRTDNYVHKSSGKSAAGRLKPGSYVLIEVSDNGMGMSADTLARAFEPFFTTKDSKTGSGLGLSMVYGFVKQSGGVVDLSSTVGKGTRVRMYLPAMVTDAPNEAHSIDQPPGVEAGGNETVLLVEDDPDVRRYVHRALSELHYAVYQAQDGVTALDMLADKPFDLLLTDVVMPGEVSGFDLVDHVREQALNTRVLCMSGYPPEMTHPGTAGKNYPLIHKPFQKSELAQAIRQVLDD
jgi:CheY-like chemotaxis protein